MDSKELLGRATEGSPLPMIVTGPVADGRMQIIETNPAGAALLELVGKTFCPALLGQPICHNCPLETGEPAEMVFNHGNSSYGVVASKAGDGEVLHVMRDITAEINERKQEALFKQTAHVLGETYSSREVTLRFLEFLPNIYRFQRGTVFLKNNQNVDGESNIATLSFCTERDDGKWTIKDEVEGNAIDFKNPSNKSQTIDNPENMVVIGQKQYNHQVILPIMSVGKTIGYMILDSDEPFQKIGEPTNIMMKIYSGNLKRSLVSETIAGTDFLTGLMNRRMLYEQLELAAKLAKREGALLGIIMFDIDDFKQFNDMYGHGVGDEVLKKLGKAIKEFFRETDIRGRYGGEEFVVALLNITDEMILHRVNEFMDIVRNLQMDYKDELLKITISVGLTMHDNRDEIGLTVNRANTAMHHAKHLGKNQAQLYTDELDRCEVYRGK